jgi:hypothetical protein
VINRAIIGICCGVIDWAWWFLDRGLGLGIGLRGGLGDGLYHYYSVAGSEHQTWAASVYACGPHRTQPHSF